MRKIVADPHAGWRRLLVGTAPIVDRLREAIATTSHLAAVTGIIERAILTSAATGTPVRFPPILMLSEPGHGKTFYARSVAGAIGTSAVPIACNQTSDRGLLGGASTAWRDARMRRLAKAILLETDSASPLYLLDEIYKMTNIVGEEVASGLLDVLKPENARAFVDEYLDLPIRSASTTRCGSPARMGSQRSPYRSSIAWSAARCRSRRASKPGSSSGRSPPQRSPYRSARTRSISWRI